MESFPPTFVKGFHDEEKIKKMEYKKLGQTAMVVSKLSLGTGGFSYLYGDYSEEECKATVWEALTTGINYIDTAAWYGHGVSESILGKCLEGIPRESYYLSTKIGRYEADPFKMFDFSASKTKKSIDEGLKRLGVDYVDVINVHDIEFAPSLDIILNETLPTLEEAVKEGKARYIGVTGYPVSLLAECVKRSKIKIDVVLSYSRLCLIDDSLKNFLPFFTSKNVGVINASSLAMGLLTNNGPQSWHPAYDDIKSICKEAANYCKEHGNLELGRLALYFTFNENGPDTTLNGMNSRNLLRSNLDVLLNGITEEEKSVLEHIQKNILSKLKEKHWEGVEIKNYKKIITSSGQQ